MKSKNYITFTDAMKCSLPAAFTTLVKPVGSACNLGCTYCYYLDKAGTIYGNRQPVMSYELLEKYIRQYISANEVPEVTFIWHGGEPLLAGLDFFKKAVALQKKYAAGKKIVNTLQTNGTLIDHNWAGFFHDNFFLIGVSLDGPQDLHDAYRKNQAGFPSFYRVINAIELMRLHEVEYNTLSVVSHMSEGRGAEVYRFLKSVGSRFMQFLPVVEYLRTDGHENLERQVIVSPGTDGSHKASWSVSGLGYGKFMTDVFDEWIINDVGSYFVQAFDNTLAQWAGVKSGLCVCSDTCGDSLVVEHNGDVYSCDHFVYPEHRLGNIQTDDLITMFRSPRQFQFGINKRNMLPRYCRQCRYYFACRGECPKHRFMKTETGENQLNALCDGFKYFYNHVEPYMDYMTMLLNHKKSPAQVMNWAKTWRSR